MVKQKNISPGVQQIVDILRPYRTEAIVNYTSLKQVSKFVARIEKRSRSKNIKHDTKLIKALIKPMMITAEEKEKRDIEVKRHWHGPHYMRTHEDWLEEWENSKRK
jgi:SOS-response transcriptional repressor LexA